MTQEMLTIHRNTHLRREDVAGSLGVDHSRLDHDRHGNRNQFPAEGGRSHHRSGFLEDAPT